MSAEDSTEPTGTESPEDSQQVDNKEENSEAAAEESAAVHAESSTQLAEDTGEEGENQEKEPLSLEECLEKKYRSVTMEQAQWERLILAYVDQGIPEPYYENWLIEANVTFSLLVRQRKRLKRYRAKKLASKDDQAS